MAAFSIEMEDLELPCQVCRDNPGKRIVGGKWVGDKCDWCGGLAFVPTPTGAAILEFLGRHAPARN